MNTLVPYAVWAIIIVIGLGAACILVFGLRNLVQGKVRPLTIGLIAVPFVILALLGLMMSTWALAAMWTVVVMFALGLLALLGASVWGLFT